MSTMAEASVPFMVNWTMSPSLPRARIPPAALTEEQIKGVYKASQEVPTGQVVKQAPKSAAVARVPQGPPEACLSP